MQPLTKDDIRKLLEQFKRKSLDDQSRDLHKTYRDAGQTIMRVITQMDALTEMTQAMQDVQRAHGATLPADLIETFQEFTTASTAMADAWIRNNAVVSRCIVLHNVAINQHPSSRI